MNCPNSSAGRVCTSSLGQPVDVGPSSMAGYVCIELLSLSDKTFTEVTYDSALQRARYPFTIKKVEIMIMLFQVLIKISMQMHAFDDQDYTSKFIEW